jgi:hypothetical protein
MAYTCPLKNLVDTILAVMKQLDKMTSPGLTMGRKKLATIRQIALEHDWLDATRPLPDDTVLASMLDRHLISGRDTLEIFKATQDGLVDAYARTRHLEAARAA